MKRSSKTASRSAAERVLGEVSRRPVGILRACLASAKLEALRAEGRKKERSIKKGNLEHEEIEGRKKEKNESRGKGRRKEEEK